MYRMNHRGVAILALAAASTLPSLALAQQLPLQKANSISLSTLFATDTGFGTNPLSVAFDNAGNAYVGGYNSTGADASIGVVKIGGALTGTPTTAGLDASKFTSPASRGIDALSSAAGAVFVDHDSGTASTSFIQRLDASGNSVWKTLSPGGVRPTAMAIDPKADTITTPGTQAPAVGFLAQGQGRRATLNLATGAIDYTFSGGAKPGAIINPTPNVGGFLYRGMAFDAAGNIALSKDDSFAAGLRVNENRFSTLDGLTNDATSRVILKSAAVNNVGNGVALLSGVASSELLVLSGRAISSGNGTSQTFTAADGSTTTFGSQFVQLRQLNGSATGLTTTQLTGDEDGIGAAYTGEVKNFATGVDANGNPALFVIDYFSKRLDIYTIEPRFNSAADGNWSTASNWTLGIIPDSRTTNATFVNATAPRLVTLDSARTVKQLKFDSANAVTIGGTATLTLSAPANDNLNAYISVLNGSHTVNAPIVLGTNARFDVNNAADTLTLNTVSGNGKVLAKRGLGTASVANFRVNTLALENGIILVRPNGTEAGLSRVGAITLGTTGATPTVGTLDLTNNGLIVDYPAAAADPYADLQSAIVAGTIKSTGIDSAHVIGIVDYATATPPTFTDPALTIDTTSVLVRYTLKGDSNLDRTVNFSDLLTLAQNYNSTTATYQLGDTNYDGIVNFSDLLSLAQNYNGTALTESTLTSLGGASFASDFALAQSLVPEPASLLAIALPLLATRRRRA